MSGRAPVRNPVRRTAKIAVRQATLEIRGASAGASAAFSAPAFASAAPASVSGTHADGGDIETALTELDMTDDDHALTAA